MKAVWISDASEALASINCPDDGYEAYYGLDTGWTYIKDESGQWWASDDEIEHGPFNTIEHATDCITNLMKERRLELERS